MMNSNSRITTKLEALDIARAERDAALTILAGLEAGKGADSPDADSFDTSVVLPKQDAVIEAERALSRTVAYTPEQALRKIAALIGEGMTAETIKTIENEAKALTTIADPVLPLFDRWQRVKAARAVSYENCPTGNFDTPDTLELDQAHDALLVQIAETTPTTLQGLAAVAEILWQDNLTGHAEGHEEWERHRNSLEGKLMTRLRNGGAVVAGLNAGV